jgi:hypothetical protein
MSRQTHLQLGQTRSRLGRDRAAQSRLRERKSPGPKQSSPKASNGDLTSATHKAFIRRVSIKSRNSRVVWGSRNSKWKIRTTRYNEHCWRFCAGCAS